MVAKSLNPDDRSFAKNSSSQNRTTPDRMTPSTPTLAATTTTVFTPVIYGILFLLFGNMILGVLGLFLPRQEETTNTNNDYLTKSELNGLLQSRHTQFMHTDTTNRLLTRRMYPKAETTTAMLPLVPNSDYGDLYTFKTVEVLKTVDKTALPEDYYTYDKAKKVLTFTSAFTQSQASGNTVMLRITWFHTILKQTTTTEETITYKPMWLNPLFDAPKLGLATASNLASGDTLTFEQQADATLNKPDLVTITLHKLSDISPALSDTDAEAKWKTSLKSKFTAMMNTPSVTSTPKTQSLTLKLARVNVLLAKTQAVASAKMTFRITTTYNPKRGFPNTYVDVTDLDLNAAFFE